VAKKKFTDGLESLFGTIEESLPDDTPYVGSNEGMGDADEDTATITRPRKKISGKNFAADLDSLFEETQSELLERESFAPKSAPVQDKVARSTKRMMASPSRPVMGLDSLIRKTIDYGPQELDQQDKKRVTFVVEKKKLDKLKNIAKERKAYLRDVLHNLVSDYITKYEMENGALDAPDAFQ
jgi:hypothetical protein